MAETFFIRIVGLDVFPGARKPFTRDDSTCVEPVHCICRPIANQANQKKYNDLTNEVLQQMESVDWLEYVTFKSQMSWQ
jgi:hypothetical protein